MEIREEKKRYRIGAVREARDGNELGHEEERRVMTCKRRKGRRLRACIL